MRTLLAAAVAALVAAPAASAWTTLSTGTLSNIVDPSALRTHSGVELVVYDNPTGNTISLVRNSGAPRVLVSGDPIAGESQLVQQPNGAIQLYFPNALGVARLTSSDDGATWTGPVQTRSTDVGGVRAAAVLPDGTPLFSQDGTGFVNVFEGLNGETVTNVFSACCGYAESLAVDSGGLAQIAFWSNANRPQSGYLYGTLGGAFVDVSGGAETVSNDNRVPLVADASGDTFGAWFGGYPTPSSFTVQTFRGGAAVRAVTLWREFRGPSQAALALEPDGKLWALWTAGGAVRAARSRSHGAHFGAQVHVNLPTGATSYQLEALARPGSATAIVNVGDRLIAQKLLPGLAVSLHRSGAVWIATVLDDGIGVGSATAHGGGRTLHANAQGRIVLAGLRRGAFVQVTAPGYIGTGFRVP